MNRVKVFLWGLMVLISGISFSQEMDLSYDAYLITMRDISISKNSPTVLKYGFNEGDEVTLIMSTNKSKPIDGLKITQNSKVLFNQSDVNPDLPISLNITEKGIVEFTFSKRSFSQDISIRIMRKSEYLDGRYFNTAIQQYKTYDTVTMVYQIDQVDGYEEYRDPAYFKVISNVDYESVQMSAKKYNLKGGNKDYFMLVKPKDTIVSENKQMVLVGYQIILTSAAGAESMWNAIKIGVDVGCLALNLFLPAGGTVAALAVETAFSMIAPQEGGEPVYFIIMNEKSELNKFTDNDNNTNPMVFESGLATGYSGNWMPMDTLIVGMQNLNMLAEIDVSLATYAIYQSTTWSEINQDIVTIKPKVVKLDMSREVIINEKTYGFQK